MRVKNYVFYVERPDGVLVRGAGRSFIIKGDKAYPAVAQLFALLDGRFTREQITAALPAKARPLFEVLVSELEDNGFLGSDERPVELDDSLRHRYADVLAYLSDWHPTPERAFVRWRAARVAVVGSGTLADATVASLRTLGQASDIGGALSVESPADLVMIVRDASSGSEALAAEVRSLRPADIAVLVAFGVDGAVQVGPLVQSGGSNLGEILRRITIPFAERLRSSDACLRIAGSLAALEALNHFANLEPGAVCAGDMSLANQMFLINALGLVQRHVIPHAYCDDLNNTPADPRWSMDDDAARGIYDAVTGIFEIDHNHVDRQLPLHMFGLAAHLRTSKRRERVIADGWGLIESDACYRAHLAVIARYTREASESLREAPIAVCRRTDRLKKARLAWTTSTSVPFRQREPTAGHETMLLRLISILSSHQPELSELAPDDGFATVEARFAGEAYRCVGETAEAASIEILGALTAALQKGWTGEVRAPGIPVLAAAADARTDAAPKGFWPSDARIDPVWSRLGWEVATLTDPVGRAEA